MKAAHKKSGGLVYSTEHGRMCSACGRPAPACICRQARTLVKAGGTVLVGRETKGRRGKVMTIITGMPLDAAALADLVRQLKQACGAGGTVQDGTVEIQGDHRDTIVNELVRLGYAAQRTGA